MSVEGNIEQTIQGTKRLFIGAVIVDLVLTGLGFVAFYALLGQGELGQDERVPAELLFAGLLVWIALCMIPIAFLTLRLKKLVTQFWKEIAEQFGYTYVHRPYFQNVALMFQEGRRKATGHGLTGTIADHAFRFFQYRYTVGSGKNSRTYHYCVAEIVFSGTVPHIYLNNIRNHGLSNLKSYFLPRIPLPAALEKDFNLHGPKQYEMEVLEIFTPDLLQHFLDENWTRDIELVDQKLYVYRESPLESSEQFQDEIQRLQKLLHILTPKLNRARLTQIGDHTTTL